MNSPPPFISAEQQELTALEQALHDLPVASPPCDLQRRIMAALPRRRGRVGAWQYALLRPRRPTTITAPLFLLLIAAWQLVLAVGAFYLLPQGGSPHVFLWLTAQPFLLAATTMFPLLAALGAWREEGRPPMLPLVGYLLVMLLNAAYPALVAQEPILSMAALGLLTLPILATTQLWLPTFTTSSRKTSHETAFPHPCRA